MGKIGSYLIQNKHEKLGILSLCDVICVESRYHAENTGFAIQKLQYWKMCTRLLTTIRDRERSGNPYRADEWRNWAEEHNFSEGTYQTVRGIPEVQGLIFKHKEKFYLDTRFANELTNELLKFLGIVKHE